MTIDQFLEAIDDRAPPAPEGRIEAFEGEIGSRLPDDFRRFLGRCDGGSTGGACCFVGPKPDGEETYVTIAEVFGLRDDGACSLRQAIRRPGPDEARRPVPLIAIMSDPGGNHIGLGLTGPHRGRVYFVDHEKVPDPVGPDGEFETAGDLELLATSFTGFVDGLQATDDVA